MPRYKLVTIIHIVCLIFLIMILGYINSKLIIYLIALDLVIQIILQNVELRKLFRSVNKYNESKEYEALINYLKNKKDKTYFKISNDSCLVNLCIAYMLDDKAIKAKELIITNPYLKSRKDLYYVLFLFAVFENNSYEINYYSEKINKLTDYYIKQKENVKNILEMINSKIYNDELYENTNFPILKRFCLKFKCENINNGDIKQDEIKHINTEFDDLNVERLNYKIDNNNLNNKPLPKRLKIIKVITIILCVLSLHIGLIIMGISMNNENVYNGFTHIESSYYMLKNIIKIIFILPLPIVTIIYGIYLNIKGYKGNINLILGVIFTGLILIFSLGFNQFKNNYSTDINYLNEITEIIEINKEDVFIITEDYDDKISSDDLYIYYESSIRINEDLNLNNNWKNNFISNKIIPSQFAVFTVNYDKFLVYCIDTNEYNPNEKEIDKDYIAIAYDIESKVLLISKYKFIK